MYLIGLFLSPPQKLESHFVKKLCLYTRAFQTVGLGEGTAVIICCKGIILAPQNLRLHRAAVYHKCRAIVNTHCMLRKVVTRLSYRNLCMPNLLRYSKPDIDNLLFCQKLLVATAPIKQSGLIKFIAIVSGNLVIRSTTKYVISIKFRGRCVKKPRHCVRTVVLITAELIHFGHFCEGNK